jgi:hypothetical protein
MRESYEDWQALGRDLIARGLGAPMLIVADGAPGLIKAIEHCWPDSDRQHCAVHRLRNLIAKLPEQQRDGVRQAYWRALDDAINPRDAKQRLRALVDELEAGGLSSAARCLADDLDALVVHLRYPTRHRRRWRSTNLLERSLGEVKRRTKVMGRFPGEDSCLTLVWAVLDLLISHETNGIRFTAPQPQPLRRPRRRRRGGDRRLNFTPVGNLSRGEFTAPKRRDPARPALLLLPRCGTPARRDPATLALALFVRSERNETPALLWDTETERCPSVRSLAIACDRD